MHLPDGVLSTPVCLVANGMAATAVGYSAWRSARDHVAPPAQWALVASGVFAVQLLNFPLAGGASGHLVGAVLAGALLGPWAGTLVVAAVLGIQAVVFGDGGIMALGANILNMAVVGAGIGGWCKLRFASPFAPAIGAMIAVPLGAALCAAQLAIGAARPLEMSLLALVPFHVALGLIEAAATAVVLVVAKKYGDRSVSLPVSLGIAGMVLLAPLASSLPDGLEAGMGTLSVATSEPAPGWIIAPDYQAPGVDHESLSLIAGAGVGALLVAFCSLLLAKAARRKTALVLRHPRTRRTLSS